MDKRQLRNQVLARRDALDEATLMDEAKAVGRHLASMAEYGRALTVMGFYSFGSELPTRRLLQDLLAAGKRLVLPATRFRPRRMEPRLVTNLDDQLVKGRWDIPEPRPDRPICPPNELDLVLVPAVAFDGEGYRVGYGGGFYDRFLANLPHRPPRVGLACSAQWVDRVPRDEHDLPVDVVVSPRGALRVRADR